MISVMLILVAIGTIVVVADDWIDRIVTRKRVAENQRAWNEYSKGMTKEEKLSVYSTSGKRMGTLLFSENVIGG